MRLNQIEKDVWNYHHHVKVSLNIVKNPKFRRKILKKYIKERMVKNKRSRTKSKQNLWV